MATHTPSPLVQEDAARLHRWEAAGHPPIPLVTDATGQVRATTTNLHSLLRRTRPALNPWRQRAVTWVDEYCP